MQRSLLSDAEHQGLDYEHLIDEQTMDRRYYLGVQSSLCPPPLDLELLAGAIADSVPDANVQPIAAAAVNQAVNYRRDSRRRKQRVLSRREKETQEKLWQAKKEQQRKLKMQLESRQQRLQAQADARAAAKQKAAAIRLAAAVTAAGNASGVPARANTRRRCPNRKYLEVLDDQAALGLGPLHTAPVAPPLDRTDSSPQAQEALKLEPQTPVKAATRADPGSPVEDPDMAASGTSAGHFSRAPPSGLGPGSTNPGSPSEDRSEIQDGRWCSPKRCSCCWATGKAKGTGATTWRKGSTAPFAGLLLCNACGVFEQKHQSLLECKPVRVDRFRAHYLALHGNEAAVGGGSSTGKGSEAESVDSDAGGSGERVREVKATKVQPVTASLADGLASYPSLGSISGHPSAAKPAGDVMDARVEGLCAAAVGQQAAILTPNTPDTSAARRNGVQATGDNFHPSRADFGNQTSSEQARQMTSRLPRTDARSAMAQAGLNISSGQAVAEVAKASRKRAADSSFAEPATKKLLRGESSNMQLTGATAAASSNDSHAQGIAAAAVPTSGGSSDSRAAHHGSGAGAAEMTEGVTGGRRRVVKVRKGRALQLVKDQIDLGDEGIQAMDMC